MLDKSLLECRFPILFYSKYGSYNHLIILPLEVVSRLLRVFESSAFVGCCFAGWVVLFAMTSEASLFALLFGVVIQSLSRLHL